MKFVVIGGFSLILGAGFFLLFHSRVVMLAPVPGGGEGHTVSAQTAGTLPPLPESTSSRAVPAPVSSGGKSSNDIEKQGHLLNPPTVVKGIYVTGWTAGSDKKVDSLITLMKRTGLNAMVIDIKDYSGYVSYHTDVPEVKASGAEGEIRIAHPNALIKKLHDNGIYAIGRVSVFQDTILAAAHPEWALRNKNTGAVWLDNHGLAWIDPAARPAWDYLASITKDAFARGFDEINFDYIRFASDGSLENISYPYWDEKSPRAKVITEYFKFLRGTFPHNTISADLFGLATVSSDDLGIGQVIQDAYIYFDYVSPMVYPSHYASGFLGYKNPADYPYEVIQYSMAHALQKLQAMGLPPVSAAASSTATSSKSSASSQYNLGAVPNAKLRPWLQAFNLGAVYDAAMVEKEITAVSDALLTASTTSAFAGWLLWDPSNNYTSIENMKL